jgi:serine/threonine protein phosphatase 1
MNPGRTIAIGDVHGCSAALAALLEVIAPTPRDTLIPLGDMIDRGPDSRGVLEQLIALAARCRLIPLLGNHEEMLIAAVRDPAALRRRRDAVLLWLGEGRAATQPRRLVPR